MTARNLLIICLRCGYCCSNAQQFSFLTRDTIEISCTGCAFYFLNHKIYNVLIQISWVHWIRSGVKGVFVTLSIGTRVPFNILFVLYVLCGVSNRYWCEEVKSVILLIIVKIFVRTTLVMNTYGVKQFNS